MLLGYVLIIMLFLTLMLILNRVFMSTKPIGWKEYPSSIVEPDFIGISRNHRGYSVGYRNKIIKQDDV